MEIFRKSTFILTLSFFAGLAFAEENKDPSEKKSEVKSVSDKIYLENEDGRYSLYLEKFSPADDELPFAIYFFDPAGKPLKNYGLNIKVIRIDFVDEEYWSTRNKQGQFKMLKTKRFYVRLEFLQPGQEPFHRSVTLVEKTKEENN